VAEVLRTSGCRPPAIGLIVLGLVALALSTERHASAQTAQSRCADCHFAQASTVATSHITSWEISAHSRANVGCDGCHGGDARTFESFLAHRDMPPRSSPSSPVHRTKIVTTCGRCHAGPFVAFQKSRHFQLWEAGNTAVPTCITCHSDTGSRLMSPKALEGQCASCHGVGKATVRPEFPGRGRAALQGIRDTRALLKEARSLVGRVKDSTRRTRLEGLAQQAEVPLVEATRAHHAFVYDMLEERLDVARRRVAMLFDELANPTR
jgi:hypothetical protein